MAFNQETAQQTGVPYVLADVYGNRAVFNDPSDVDNVGVLAGPDAISGLDSPEVRSQVFDLVEADGAVFGPAYHGNRPITIQGFIQHGSVTERNTRETRLYHVINNMMRANGTLTWTPTGSVSQYVSVRKHQPIRIKGQWNKEFLLALIAADPRIYATTASSLTTVAYNANHTATNDGSEFAPPQSLRIFGPSSGTATSPQITRTWNGQVVYTKLTGLTLGVGEYVDVDFINKTVTKNTGANLYAYYDWTVSSWWALGPGSNTVRLDWTSGTTTGTTFSLNWRHTWL